MFNKVLMATDGSEASKAAIKYYLDRASKNTEFILLTVTAAPRDPRADPTDKIAIQRGQMWERHNDSIRFVKQLRQDLNVKPIFKEGNASDIIADTADEEDVDLIIMGSRGIGGIKSVLLGSTSKAVVDKCRKPILIIK